MQLLLARQQLIDPKFEQLIVWCVNELELFKKIIVVVRFMNIGNESLSPRRRRRRIFLCQP